LGINTFKLFGISHKVLSGSEKGPNGGFSQIWEDIERVFFILFGKIFGSSGGFNKNFWEVFLP